MNIFTFIKSRISITEVVQEYVTLKKMGLYLKGRCPFHHERTGSFTVSPHREIFYCFGCHKGGDVVNFIAAVEHCTPLEAVKYLSERYNIELPLHLEYEKTETSTDDLKRYHTLCLHFAQWCHQQLVEQHYAQQSSAYQYLLSRGISLPSMRDFTIGVLPEGRIAECIEQMRSTGFMVSDLIQAHIIAQGKSGLYSPFAERIIFPIRDYLGRVCGFGGRTFRTDDQRPKYYNSQDHPFFSKGHIVFGLDRAKKAIQTEQNAFLVEGYLDCIAMAQAGHLNTVATLGTACTIEHLKLLARYAQRLYIVYDADSAGQQAITKLAHLSWTANMELFVISLPDKEDPASFLQKNETLQSPLAKAQDIFLFFIQRLGAVYQNKPLQDRLTLVQDFLDVIGQIDDRLKQSFLLQKAATTFSIPLEVLEQKRARPAVSRAYDHTPGYPKETIQPSSTEHPAEKQIFLSVFKSGRAPSADDEQLILQTCCTGTSLLIEKLLLYIKGKNSSQQNDFLATLSSQEKELAIRLIIQGEEEPDRELEEILKPLWKKEWRAQASLIKLRLKQAEEGQAHPLIGEIMKDFNDLKDKMRQKGIL